MTTKIEFHVLQSFPPSNLNRDDTNTPKDCDFGGVRRARISSQCIKRAIRLHPDFASITGVKTAERTRWLAREIKDSLIALGKENEESEKVAIEFVQALLGSMDKKNPERSMVLFYLSGEEKEEIASLLNQDWEATQKGDFEPIVKTYIKKFSGRTSAPEIALFGRMLAEEPKLSLEAACQVAHAISTHKASLEMDFYTAVDDLIPDDTAGAGMMGMTGFNSATFYRYAAIDWEQLVKNLSGDEDLATKTVKGFTAALAKAIPTGKQNAFAAQAMPVFIMVVIREDGQAWSLANAFETPVAVSRRDGGYLKPSLHALDKHWAQLQDVYGNPDKPAQPVVLTLLEDESLVHLDQYKEKSLHSLVEKVAQLIEKVK